MPLINVKLIEGVFNEAQKKKLVTGLTDAPRRRELGIDVNRAVEPDGRQHIR